MSHARHGFVPALGHELLTPLYDFVAPLLGERRFKRRLIELARIEPGHEVLDIGCGTGTLALMAQAMHPRARLTGLDIDAQILAIARNKIVKAKAPIDLEQGSATEPPFPPASFDRVLTTLMLHHLSHEQKQQALAAARRLLRRGGELHVADFGKPHNALMRVVAKGFRLLDGGDSTADNLSGALPGMIAAAGFEEVEETERWMTPFGTLSFIAAR